jgi:putative nucleotidyltransferase with HDIG domain/predicted Zn finger-like uncharacterized protein
MKFECSGCQKRYQIQNDQLPKDKKVKITCKNCGAVIHLDLRDNNSMDEAQDTATSTQLGGSASRQQENDSEVVSLKKKIAKGIDDLPAMPQVVIKAHELIADSNSDAQKIAEVIEVDQGITSKVLQVANSAYYGMSGKISAIQQALVVLGYKTLVEIITMAGTSSVLAGKLPGYGYEAKDLWQHSLAVAFASKTIANMKKPDLANEAHTAGLIHDVGKIILDSYILEKKEPIENFMEKEEKSFLDAESEFFGFNHAEMASEVCKKWNFPDTIASAIKFHHQPSGSNGDDLANILHVGDYVAMLSGIGYDNDDILYELEQGTMDFLDLNQDDISNTVLLVTETVNDIAF